MCKRSNCRKVTDIVALHISNQKVSKKKKREKKKGFLPLELPLTAKQISIWRTKAPTPSSELLHVHFPFSLQI